MANAVREEFVHTHEGETLVSASKRQAPKHDSFKLSRPLKWEEILTCLRAANRMPAIKRYIVFAEKAGVPMVRRGGKNQTGWARIGFDLCQTAAPSPEQTSAILWADMTYVTDRSRKNIRNLVWRVLKMTFGEDIQDSST